MEKSQKCDAEFGPCSCGAVHGFVTPPKRNPKTGTYCIAGCIKEGGHDTCHRGPVEEVRDLKPKGHGGLDPVIGSVKHDAGKYDPTMLTVEMVELVSRVRMFGANKYARNNFKKTGFQYTRSLAAALRHIFAFLNGEDNDPESGLNHLGHAICCLEHCIYDTIHHPGNDNRK